VKFSTTIAVVFLFVLALGAYLRLQAPKSGMPQEPEVENIESVQQLLDLNVDEEIVWIQIQNLEKNTVITLAKSEKGWKLKHPVEDFANAQIIEAFTRELQPSQKKESLAPEKDWEEYGLKRPAFKIGIETSKNKTRRYLYLGDQSPVAEMIFARWEDGDRYFLLDKQVKGVFAQSLYALREKRVFLLADQPSKLFFRVGGESIKLVFKDQLWFWDRPVELYNRMANQENVEKILQQIQNLYVKDFIDTPAGGDAARGFSEQADYLRLWDSQNQASALMLGQEYLERDAFYGKRESFPGVLLIEREKIRALLESIMTLTREAKGL